MRRLRAGERLHLNYANGTYQFTVSGKVANVTFRSLRDAGLIRELDSTNEWVAAKASEVSG